MKKRFILSLSTIALLFSTNLFANETKTTDPMAILNAGKIFIDGNNIKVENEEIRNKIIKFIKDDILIKNPTITMEIVNNEKESDINIDACASCHGYDYDKQALSKSKVISKMSKEEIEEALLGYKDGTYGGAMKSLMKSQVMKYTDDELKEIAKIINQASLNKQEVKEVVEQEVKVEEKK